MDITNIIKSQYSYLIKEDNGSKYILNDEIDSIEGLSKVEKNIIRMVFNSSGITCKERMIVESDRVNKSTDFDYGIVQAHEIIDLDKPRYSTIEFNGNQITYENYDMLDDFILNQFVPEKVVFKVNKSKNSGNIEQIPYPSIRLSDIVKLRLSELEVKHVIEFLESENIRVSGVSPDLNGEFDNYDYVKTYANTIKVEGDYKEINKLFDVFYETKDPVLREKIIIANLHLVDYCVFLLSKNHQFDLDELKQYGYIGLIESVERFDPSLGFAFSSYAVPYIMGVIKNYIPELDNVFDRNKYYWFNECKKIVEKQWGVKYNNDSVEMLEEIIDLMVFLGYVQESDKNVVMRQFGVTQSYEEYIEHNDLYSYYNISDKIFNNMIGKLLNDLLDTLRPIEKNVLCYRYGLIDGKIYTLNETAKILDVSIDVVRNVEYKALMKMRHPSRSMKLRNSLDNINDDTFNLSDSTIVRETERVR